MQDMVSELEAEKKRLENQISAMKIKADQTMRRNAELRASEDKKHAEEIVFLKKTSAQLKVRISFDETLKNQIIACELNFISNIFGRSQRSL